MIRFTLPTLSILLISLAVPGQADAQALELPTNSRIAVIGNNLADRMQHQGWLEAYIQAIHPKQKISFRHLGFTGDEVNVRPRSNNFGSALPRYRQMLSFAFLDSTKHFADLSRWSNSSNT